MLADIRTLIIQKNGYLLYFPYRKGDMTMEAIIQDSYNGIDDLKIKEVEEPKLSPFSALVETKYTPVLPYDWRTETGELQMIRPVKLPIVIGYGFGGIVKSVGSLRNNNLVGQKVIGASISGSNSTLVDSKMPPLLFKVPEGVDLAAATSIIGGADAALGIINKLHLDTTDKVLITGASGGIGTYLIQLLRLRHIKVIAMGHTSNLKFLKKVGADEVIDYTENISEQLLYHNDITQVVDTAGNIKLLEAISEINSSKNIVSIATNRFSNFIHPNIFPSDYEKLLRMLLKGELHAYIQDVFSYKDVRMAQSISQKHHSQGRILLSY
ncbi:hypothetical protein FC72_GL001466 [Companilactobacillus tucceti DSM 20183]|uniref:Uncharacterized protein n=2 Tax=Companilactobacillus tucceti TaxID=238012 RepID=A0A0R1J8R8_9LACO|nr:hypothetical protein FC72_GL001466 [Companilactobacillus tucceti DSM 20183]